MVGALTQKSQQRVAAPFFVAKKPHADQIQFGVAF
jgi:hypothetical protein